MRIIKRIFETVSEKRSGFYINKRIVTLSNKRDVWNERRRFSY